MKKIGCESQAAKLLPQKAVAAGLSLTGTIQYDVGMRVEFSTDCHLSCDVLCRLTSGRIAGTIDVAPGALQTAL